jgi:two-component system nitrogen regulation sensor histidine kinase NtrY
MKFASYPVQVSLRLAILFLALSGLAFSVAYEREYTLMLVMSVVVVLTVTSLFRYTNKFVRTVTTFLEGFRHGDFQQNVAIEDLGEGFADLQTSLQNTARSLQQMRSEQAQQALYFQSLVQHLPLPFLILHDDGRVEIMNMASRRAFNVAEIASTDDLGRFGASFQRDVLQIQAGESLLSSVRVEDAEEYYILTASTISMDGRQQKLVALLNIQGELDATELATWQNLLRVTSHEILNSLAPVSSCAQTAESLVADVLAHDIGESGVRSDLEDIRDAVETMARRSEGLMRFVRSYRQLTRMPPPKLEKIGVGDFFARLESLLKIELAQKQIGMSCDSQPANLSLLADKDMLDQAMINLVRNAADAVLDIDDGAICIRAFVDSKQRVILEVADNGSGIDPVTAKSIFVPFFTTKGQGSGVGLALVRYIMLSHGGTAVYAPGPESGSVFRLVL